MRLWRQVGGIKCIFAADNKSYQGSLIGFFLSGSPPRAFSQFQLARRPRCRAVRGASSADRQRVGAGNTLTTLKQGLQGKFTGSPSPLCCLSAVPSDLMTLIPIKLENKLPNIRTSVIYKNASLQWTWNPIRRDGGPAGLTPD